MTAVDRYSPNSLRRHLSRLNSITFRDDAGEIEYFGQRILILRRDMFKVLVGELEKRHASGTGKMILGILGRSEGHEEGRTLMADVMLESADRRSIPIFIKNAVEDTNLGYGKLKLGDLDVSTKSATITTQNSVEAMKTGDSGEIGCFFLLGYLEGLLSELLSTALMGSETACRGKGNDTCRFEIGAGLPPSKWKL